MISDTAPPDFGPVIMALAVERMHPDDLQAIVRAVRVGSPWLSAAEAAEYLRAPLSRIRKLTMTRDLPCEHDGSRVLYHREQLDKFLLAGGAKSP